jgi:hypothetical protein
MKSKGGPRSALRKLAKYEKGKRCVMNDVKIGKVFLSVAGCGTYGFVG